MCRESFDYIFIWVKSSDSSTKIVKLIDTTLHALVFTLGAYARCLLWLVFTHLCCFCLPLMLTLDIYSFFLIFATLHGRWSIYSIECSIFFAHSCIWTLVLSYFFSLFCLFFVYSNYMYFLVVMKNLGLREAIILMILIWQLMIQMKMILQKLRRVTKSY